jgi:prepilin signal peptidase PulO-like enzyme (type II secretory pathway)
LALVGGFFDNYRLALLGGAIGFFSALLLYLLGKLFVAFAERLTASRITEVPFGPGDVKLAAFIGLVVGFPAIVFALVLGALVGGLGAGAFLFFKALFRRPPSPFTPIPYGPFLSIGGFTMMIYGKEFIEWYLNTF